MFLGLTFAVRRTLKNMTLKFNPSYWQVPRSSVGRASDRTMLRSVVRVQSLARGNLSFCLFFLQHFFHHIFLLTNNKPLMSFFSDTHIKLITTVFFSSVFFFWHNLSFLFYFSFFSLLITSLWCLFLLIHISRINMIEFISYLRSRCQIEVMD